MSNAFLRCFDSLYACQTRQVGTAIVATITGQDGTVYCTGALTLLSGVDENPTFMEGTTGEGGGYNLKIKAGDLTAEPPKTAAVICNGSAEDAVLQVVSAALVNGIYQIQVGDIQA